MEEQEQEVFRLILIPGKYYETALHTRRIGIHPNEKFFTINKIEYVGKFISYERSGFYGDAPPPPALFDNAGKTEKVYFTYEGTRCFREIIHQEK